VFENKSILWIYGALLFAAVSSAGVSSVAWAYSESDCVENGGIYPCSEPTAEKILPTPLDGVTDDQHDDEFWSYRLCFDGNLPDLSWHEDPQVAIDEDLKQIVETRSSVCKLLSTGPVELPEIGQSGLSSGCVLREYVNEYDFTKLLDGGEIGSIDKFNKVGFEVDLEKQTYGDEGFTCDQTQGCGRLRSWSD